MSMFSLYCEQDDQQDNLQANVSTSLRSGATLSAVLTQTLTYWLFLIKINTESKFERIFVVHAF